MKLRVVIETNLYVSRLLRPTSVPGSAVLKAWHHAETLMSTATWAELCIVLKRPKFTHYIAPGALEPYLRHVWAVAEQVKVDSPVLGCRDPKDNKFLEVAVHGHAALIVTGDADLLDLNPFRGIVILTPRAYLERESVWPPTRYS